MEEFYNKDYSGARSAADSVKVTADKIMAIFENVDRNMNLLYGDAWQSTGADSTCERYQQIRKNYEVFYKKVVDMHDYIHKATTQYEEADTKVSGQMLDVQ